MADTDSGLAYGESRATQHQTESGDDEGDPRGRHHRLEDRWEARPRHDEHEHQPDVVRLPHRSHGVVDELPSTGAAILVPREQVPGPRTEVCAPAAAVR